METAIATPVVRDEQPLGSMEDRRKLALNIAARMFAHQPPWISFFRELLGVGGQIRKLFPTPAEFAEFEKTPEYAEILAMLTQLRKRGEPQKDEEEPTRVITVRLPKSLHESLRAEAHERNISMNKLCISKLLRAIDDEAFNGRSATPLAHHEADHRP